MFKRSSRCVDEIGRRLGDNGTSIQIAFDGRHVSRWQRRDIRRYATRLGVTHLLCSSSRTTATAIAHHGPASLRHAACIRPVHERQIQYPTAVYPPETHPGAQFTPITCWTSFAQQHPDCARNEPTAIYGPLT